MKHNYDRNVGLFATPLQRYVTALIQKLFWFYKFSQHKLDKMTNFLKIKHRSVLFLNWTRELRPMYYKHTLTAVIFQQIYKILKTTFY